MTRTPNQTRSMVNRLAEQIIKECDYQFNQWGGWDYPHSGECKVRTSYEHDTFTVMAFDGWSMLWKAEFTDAAPEAVVKATIKAAIKEAK